MVVCAWYSMLPQLAVGGCTPTPKKLSALSIRMPRPTASVVATAAAGSTPGNTCRSTTRAGEAPIARAADTKSRAASDSTSARTTRAVSIQPASPTSSTSTGTLGCSTAAAIISSGNRGIASIASVMRISTSSASGPA